MARIGDQDRVVKQNQIGVLVNLAIKQVTPVMPVSDQVRDDGSVLITGSSTGIQKQTGFRPFGKFTVLSVPKDFGRNDNVRTIIRRLIIISAHPEAKFGHKAASEQKSGPMDGRWSLPIH